MNQTLNLAIASLPQTLERYTHLTVSDMYAVGYHRFAIPNTVYNVSSIEKLLLPFTPSVWLITIVYLFFAFVLILLTKLLKRRFRHFIIGGRMNRTPILNMFNILLGGSVTNSMMTNLRYFGTFARTIMMIWILSTLILRNSYQGSLFNHLRFSESISPYDTIAKILKSDIPIYTRSLTGKSSIKLSRLRMYKGDIQYMLQRLYQGEIYALVACLKSHVDYFNSNRNGVEPLQLSIDSLNTFSLCIYFNNQTVFEDIFNQKIMQLRENGLIEAVYRHFLKSNSHKIDRQKLPSQIDFKTVSGIFQIGYILFLFSILLFLLELISKRSPFVKKIIDFINY